MPWAEEDDNIDLFPEGFLWERGCEISRGKQHNIETPKGKVLHQYAASSRKLLTSDNSVFENKLHANGYVPWMIFEDFMAEVWQQDFSHLGVFDKVDLIVVSADCHEAKRLKKALSEFANLKIAQDQMQENEDYIF